MEQDLFMEFVDGIVKIPGDKLTRIILYGSVAKGTDTSESDIDIALIIRGTMDLIGNDDLSDFIVDMDLKYDRVFSVIRIDQEHFRKWMNAIPFYKNVDQEGIILWKAV